MKKTLVAGKKEISFESPIVMGILNVTPDSFYDGGRWKAEEKAIGRVQDMIRNGAGIIDIGAESTRPGADPVPVQEELDRLMPVLEWVVDECDVIISVDTYKSQVADWACSLGAHIVNDVSGGCLDPAIFEVAARHKSGFVINHMRGTPQTMRDCAEYADILLDMENYFRERLLVAQDAGIPRESLVLDPGIGFAKAPEHNPLILKRLDRFVEMGYPVLVGASRKSFIGHIMDVPVQERLAGSLAAAAIAVYNGANIIRCHDVEETVQAVRVADATLNAG